MAETPVPLPPELVPADAAAWLSCDAERWRALRPGRWAHPFPTVLALVLASMAALRLAPGDAYFCDDKGPCTPDWLGTAMAALVAAVVYRGIRLLPLATAAVLPLVAIWALLDPGTPTAAGITMAVAACYACLGCLHRLAVARRQRRLALEIAGPGRYPLPETAMTRPGDGKQLGCGIVMVGAAVLAFVLGLLRVTPFMGSNGWQLVAFFGTIIGLLSLAYYVRDRRRAAALRRGPVPALRVLVREGVGETTGVRTSSRPTTSKGAARSSAATPGSPTASPAFPCATGCVRPCCSARPTPEAGSSSSRPTDRKRPACASSTTPDRRVRNTPTSRPSHRVPARRP